MRQEPPRRGGEPPIHSVEVTARELNAKDIINGWKCPSTISWITVDDLFNDKLNYDPKTFLEVSKLNTEMFTVRFKKRKNLQ